MSPCVSGLVRLVFTVEMVPLYQERQSTQVDLPLALLLYWVDILWSPGRPSEHCGLTPFGPRRRKGPR